MKKFSSKRNIQLLAHWLKEMGVEDIIISPGSRNAPMTIHFAETEYFNCYSIIDERSAGFSAIGMSKFSQKPTAIVCTSGSATANYYPAVTEAFYQNIPLIILTADRPEEFVDLFDGQTIRQKNFFAQHCFGSFQIYDDDHPENEKIIQNALEICQKKQGPVHLNIPLKEPLYEFTGEIPTFGKKNISLPENLSYSIKPELIQQWNEAKKILILVGRQNENPTLEHLLSQLAKNHTAVILCESHSNLKNPKFFHHIDRYIYHWDEEKFSTFAPDLLITLGQNVISKKVKQFLRKNPIKNHWHIDPYWQPDTYFSLSEKIETSGEIFFNQFIKQIEIQPSNYYNVWQNLKNEKDELHQKESENIKFSDLRIFKILASKIPENYHLHFSNSSAIRYAQLFDFQKFNNHCNRGTSGIEGSSSTAIGYAMKNPNPTLLITGDLSFFYDINALWNQYIPPYLRIIIINNGGGDIFNIIPGPGNANSSIVEEFISTQHQKTAQSIAEHFNFSYLKITDDEDLNRILDHFFEKSNRPRILEFITQDKNNADVLKNYFNQLK